jgi:CHAD domain-containing protein
MTEKETKQFRELKPALTGYIRDSLVLLRQLPVPDDAAIHDIRVLMKRQRATIKLVKPLLDEKSYRREYLAGREVGRILCSWREMSVLYKTAKALKKENPKLFIKLWDNETIQNLLRKPYSTWTNAGEQSKSVKVIRAQLNKAQYRVRFLNLKEPDISLLLEELGRNYLIAAKAYLDCRNDPRQRLLHEFRKKSKTLMYQLYYFRHLSQPAIKSLEKKLDYITQNLGKYNDLAQITGMIGYKYGNPGNSPVLDELAVVIRDKQDKYLSKVWPTAYRIFAPGKFPGDLPGLTVQKSLA